MSATTAGIFQEQLFDDRDHPYQLLVVANSLRSYLESELVRLRNCFSPELRLKQVYESVCLPIAGRLAGRLDAVDIPDTEILHQSLAADPESAESQLRRLLKFLYLAVTSVSEKCAPPM